jgi:hypothetical protein
MSTLIRETDPTGGRLPSLLPQHEQENGAYAATGENNPLPVAVYFAKGMIPVQPQEFLTPQEKILTAYSVSAGATANITANPLVMTGYTDMGLGIVASASHAWTASVLSSPDGALMMETLVTKAGTSANKTLTATTIMDYGILQIINSGAATYTYDVWFRKFNR